MIVKMSAQEALYVSLNMRDVDYRELTANRWTDGKSRDEICEEIGLEAIRYPGVAWTCYEKNEPVAIGGMAQYLPSVGTGWLWATKRIRKRNWLEITKCCKHQIKNVLENGIVNRVEALSVNFHKESHYWLEQMGMKKECTLSKRGKGGEDFHFFSIIKE